MGNCDVACSCVFFMSCRSVCGSMYLWVLQRCVPRSSCCCVGVSAPSPRHGFTLPRCLDVVAQTWVRTASSLALFAFVRFLDASREGKSTGDPQIISYVRYMLCAQGAGREEYDGRPPLQPSLIRSAKLDPRLTRSPREKGAAQVNLTRCAYCRS